MTQGQDLLPLLPWASTRNLCEGISQAACLTQNPDMGHADPGEGESSHVGNTT